MIVVGDPVALLLGLEDLAAEPVVVGPGAHHLVEQPRRLQGVLPGLDEEVEEGAIARQEGEARARAQSYW